jgi:hypothetical protein
MHEACRGIPLVYKILGAEPFAIPHCLRDLPWRRFAS